jgi:hypothetical protein
MVTTTEEEDSGSSVGENVDDILNESDSDSEEALNQTEAETGVKSEENN